MQCSVVVLLLSVGFTISIPGCQGPKQQEINFTNPEAVAEALVQASFEQDLDLVNQCYGREVITKTGKDTENIRYRTFLVQDFTALSIQQVEHIGTESGYDLVGIAYDLTTADGLQVPCYEKLFLTKQEGQYHVLPEAEVPDTQKYSWTLQKALLDSEVYQDYQVKEQTFEEQNPDYQLGVYGAAASAALNQTGRNQKSDQGQITSILILVLIITILQLLIMGVWRVRIQALSAGKGDTDVKVRRRTKRL